MFTSFDLFFLIFTLIFALSGAYVGFLRQVLWILGIILPFYFAWILRGLFGGAIAPYVIFTPLANIIAFVLLLFAFSIVIGFVLNMLSRTVFSRMIRGMTNSVLGFFVGTFVGVGLISICFAAVLLFNPPSQLTPDVRNSTTYALIGGINNKVFGGNKWYYVLQGLFQSN